MKKLITIRPAPAPHWVGDGFPVRSLFSMHEPGFPTSPFLLLDYAAPYSFDPTEIPKGVGEHPHKGFETVTIVFQGELEHRDSTGSHGRIGEGDVQWMTAGSGLVHEELHAKEFARRGGTIEMVQLWVNLPAKDKSTPPRYQTLEAKAIPSVDLPGGAGSARVIAGELEGTRGPAKTFTPVAVWDVSLAAGKETELPAPEGFTTLVVPIRGRLRLAGGSEAGPADLAVHTAEGSGLALSAVEAARSLVLSGAPIHEPIAAYGPFVMNTPEEIREAIEQFRTGAMGHL
jgi:redox-sensitive bicupin YhaK (pirin superfamily)